MIYFFLFTLIVQTIYCILIIRFNSGWQSLKVFLPSENKPPDYKISLIIAVRNEEKNLDNLFKCILNQELAPPAYEIIFVDDHSTDESSNILEKACQNNPFFCYLRLPEGATGKKQAIRYGVQKAKGDLLVFTDADCVLPKKWLACISEYYSNHHPAMILMPVQLTGGEGWFSKFQQLEFMSLIGSTAAAAALNKAIMCNGANMAVERKLFVKNNINGEKFSSGDDIFQLLEIKKTQNHRIHFLKSSYAIIYTSVAKSIGEFIHQRLRWVSKSGGYHDFDIIFVAFVVYLTNLLILMHAILSFFHSHLLYPFLISFLAKSVVDYVFLQKVTVFFKDKTLLRFFFPFQVVYIIYISVIGILGNFVNFSWKGRRQIR